MASTMLGAGEENEPPRKRQKLSSPTSEPQINDENITSEHNQREAFEALKATMQDQIERETRVGILHYVNESNAGFVGTVKQRYTDFIVNEISLDGKVVHLTEIGLHRSREQIVPAKVDDSTLERESVDLAGLSSQTADAAAGSLTGRAVEANGVPAADVVTAEISNCFTGSVEDIAILDSHFSIAIRESIVKLYEKALRHRGAKPASLGFVSSAPIIDRQLRTSVHGNMRRIFQNVLETVSDADGVIKIFVAPKKHHQYDRGGRDSTRNRQAKGKLGWQELGGEYLHFSLYKENKDTMEVVGFMASRLKVAPRQFGTAGTKDRRAATVQRISIRRMHAEQLAGLNKALHNAKIGNFSYEKHGLQLGDLMGNEFLITLRDCEFCGFGTADEAYSDRLSYAKKVVDAAIGNLQREGFLNYFGLQRFGTHGIGTEEVGKRILQGDYKGAVDMILAYNEKVLQPIPDNGYVGQSSKPIPGEDISRAQAINLYRTTGNAKAALEKLPRKFSGESHLIRHLHRHDQDFLGALSQIPRNLKTMYVHAYQSYVWNMVASMRWDLFGDGVVAGDLVLDDTTKSGAAPCTELIDENGEAIFLPAADDLAVSSDDIFQRAHALTDAEVASGRYTIFDIVLPTPGFDINYPANKIGDFYKEFMASEKGGRLDPANMRRSHKDFSLSGSYRKLMGQVGEDVSFEVKLYDEPNEQIVRTDLERILNDKRDPHMSRLVNPTRAYPNPDAASVDQGRSEKHNAWENLPAKPVSGQRAETLLPDPKAFEQTLVQTSAEGQRTGHHETTIMAGSSRVDLTSESNTIYTIPEDVFTSDGEHEVSQDAKFTRERRNTGASQSRKSSFRSVSSEGSVAVLPFDLKNLGKRYRKRPAETPLDNSTKKPKPNDAENKKRIAVIIQFKLASSVYATMALRELMKIGGARGFIPAYSGLR